MAIQLRNPQARHGGDIVCLSYNPIVFKANALFNFPWDIQLTELFIQPLKEEQSTVYIENTSGQRR